MAFNDIRKRTPCRFSDGFSRQEFETLALTLMKKIKRIKNIRFDGAIIHYTVESQTHISEWDFSVDFNDWGHITGVFWTDSGNYDSSIPKNFGMTLSGWIQTALNREGIKIREVQLSLLNMLWQFHLGQLLKSIELIVGVLPISLIGKQFHMIRRLKREGLAFLAQLRRPV